MKIIVDGFGGDHAPLAVLQGCEMAVKEYNDIFIVLTGDEKILKKTAEDNNISRERMEFVHANGVIAATDDADSLLKDKANTTMGVGFQLLKEGKGDAFLSAGSTAALVVGASLIIKRIKGIKRAALSPILPTAGGCYMLIDAGANLECRPEMLLQFGVMGSVYMKNIIGIDKPRVGLANIGEEANKGFELQQEAYKLLENANIHFVGNAEGRGMPLGEYDVVVADGFTGNMILKLSEGWGKFIGNSLKSILKKNFVTKMGALTMLGPIKAFTKEMDYTEYGGSPLLGVNKPVIKAHGSSDANAFKNAIRQAREFHNKKIVDLIREHVGALEK